MKIAKRTNKEYKVLLHDNLLTKYGTVNRINPKVIYLSCKTWIESNDINDINEIIQDIFITFKKELFNNIYSSNIFDKNFITNFEIKTSSMKSKKKFFNFEIYLKQKNNVMAVKELKPNVIDLFQPLLNHLILNFNKNYLILSKGK